MFICGACPCCFRTVDPRCPRFRISALSVSLSSFFILPRPLALSPVIATCFCLSPSASSVFCCLVSICGCSWCAFPAHLHLQPPVPLSSPLPLSTATFPRHLPSPPSLPPSPLTPSFQVRAHLRRVSLSFLFANRGPLLPSFLRRVPFLGSLQNGRRRSAEVCTHVTVCVILRQNVSCGQNIWAFVLMSQFV